MFLVGTLIILLTYKMKRRIQNTSEFRGFNGFAQMFFFYSNGHLYTKHKNNSHIAPYYPHQGYKKLNNKNIKTKIL